ncbi:glycoside hydrolase family 3 C-terminal domain-containing protein [Agromyces cerinus]|uniref:Exo-alpha-(1->6)-L-arabinopyranosidase n=1 Tax=Agromyces cerinus subsp. cerinus TaxID=232089 RepID=A0A1N6GGR2_9MICO|nr:glycoside hydrolase family 3 C-terminal domain-containing protein [Agromyces cerinus]SIO06602.1 beta-glucosidase [Agromyces cerinus subsp. cerinus]
MTDTLNTTGTGLDAPAADIVAGLTVEEKASLTSGASFWTTQGVERAGIPAIVLTDGPHGVRLQKGSADHLGIGDSVPATCFPPAVALGSTFDPELLERVGTALGEEARAEGVGVLLGPGVNIKRSPLCGRNFEYLSEDPIISGVLGAALVNGLQSQGVGGSLKHFAANNQEHDRMSSSSDVDPRPLREIYLRGFQRVVEDAQPWTVMCSYNRLNGVYTSEDPWLLNTVLRDDWGFEGLVVSDWGAVNDRVVGLPAGLDLEMPSSDGRSAAKLLAAVADGSLDESALDVGARRVVELVQKAVDGARPSTGSGSEGYDVDAHHALAREAAGRGAVLLKNDDAILPLDASASVAVIGAFAEKPRYQGAGSSLINPTKLDNALDAITEYAGQDNVAFAAGFTTDGSDGAALVAPAVELAASKDVVVLFLGLPGSYESEGFDREDLHLPAEQLALLESVVAANPRTVVVLANGGVVELPFADDVPAILEGWLGGQAGGSAIADVLYGAVNPSGRLAETIPVKLADTPAYLNFPGDFGHVRYGEGLFVGYRWYDARDAEVRYPFGHGLSYTSFGYSDLSVAADASGLTVRVTVTNTGDRAGREVVQVYTGLAASGVQRAPREIKAFANVALEAGESREVEIAVRDEDLAYWDVRVDRWVVEPGAYSVEVGASSRDIRLSAVVEVEGEQVRIPLSLESSIAELAADPIAGPIVMQAMGSFASGMADTDIFDEGGLDKMMASFPIGKLAGFPGVPVTPEQIQQLIDLSNSQRG